MKIVLLVLILQLTLAEKRERRSIRWHPQKRSPTPPDSDTNLLPFILYTNLTATETYDPMNELCCLGKAFPKPQRSDQSCCGGIAFDASKNLCCDGVVKDRTQGTRCCGPENYNVDSAICCNKKIVAASAEELNSNTLACCGQEKYDHTKSICCGVTLHEKKSEKDYCCGSEVSNSDTQICCFDQLRQGEIILNTTWHVLSKDQNKGSCCWGGKMYDPASQTCCGTLLVEGTNQKCCGNNAFDPDNQLCCLGSNGDEVPVAGKASAGDGCCDSKVGNAATHLCCQGNLLPRPGPSYFCCNDQPFDSADSLCIPRTDGNTTTYELVKKTDTNQDAVCGDTPVVDANQLCCRTFDGLKSLPKTSNASLMCCGDQSYEWGKGTCCADVATKQFKLHERSGYTLDCCGLELFDKNTEICCGGKVYPKEDSTACCIQSVIYDTRTELCCAILGPQPGDVTYSVWKKTSSMNQCCGLKIQDKSTEICCNGQTYLYSPTARCCGTDLYDSRAAVCCGGKLLPMKNGRSTSCCYAGLDSSLPDNGLSIVQNGKKR